MPEYMYRCNDCLNLWTEERSMFDVDPKICPECKSENVHRKFTPHRVNMNNNKYTGNKFFDTNKDNIEKD